MRTTQITYDDGITRQFLWATTLWGLVALLLGVVVATQLSFWQANFGTSWLSFGRLRPLHTNAAIFAFVGNMMFAGIYYSTQRLLKARMASDILSRINFWGWQLIIVSAALTLPMGYTQGKEYAELIWPIDIAIAVVWVVFAINFFWTIAKRNEPKLYVAIWFYIATIITIAVLHIVNSLVIPTSPVHSYSLYAGVQDALVQWWYGHNAVGFFLTTPILGIMYYFLPKAAERPVYSYRLSIVHFWALIFIYIWAGPHHLLNTALPAWTQSLGMVFSLMLWAPSWGGMLNGLLTLRGAWDKLRTEPVIKFYVVAITFYGMSTFEGPLLSIKAVNSLAHYTDWIIAHVHAGALGWNGFMAAGMIYWLVPRLYGTNLWSKRLADAHFWIGTFGLLLYVVAMWTSGINQGLFWQALDADGFLKYPDFVEGLVSARFLYHMRLIGGTLYLLGYILLIVNVVRTVASGKAVNVTVDVAVPEKEHGPGFRKLVLARPIVFTLMFTGLGVIFFYGGLIAAILALGGMLILATATYLLTGDSWGQGYHRALEGNSTAFTVLVLVAILAGGIAELIPSMIIRNEVPAISSTGELMTQKPYSPLELAGRDVYIAEGCYNCHSQMIRPLRHETLRYGEYSRLDEFIYDHPFQFGSKRTGPDLHRVGGKYPDLWHYTHMMDPRSTSPGSNMPSYAWLKDSKVSGPKLQRKLEVMRLLGVPYSDDDIASAEATMLSQGKLISDALAETGIELEPDSQMAAIIAYLQRMGRGPRPTGPEEPVAEGGLE
ncbi:MAG: cytochrome-c oxidase, cbb3-type subunit I [Candidatus Eisenbacteria bacterium]|uniref:Cytochrome-c oxidase, cbb3-type subunit I n=1 Tax=Eiseniibacteriota bacterium TaxID=2212470 RepID=A0A7Y2ECD7_UNCEI|nr:cytochrome-c oxidase, cbb3-type subunit I [Candidatus Eisenbacteria bacterium]